MSLRWGLVWARGLALCCLVVIGTAALGQKPYPAPAGLLDFSADERARILAHGPWPPPPAADAANPVQGRADAVALGRALFAHPGLSASGQMACATCHDPAQGFQDGRRFTRHGRNTPGLWDVAMQRWFAWDGAQDALWAASLAPLTSAEELAATPASARALLQGQPALSSRYRRLFGPPVADDALLVNLARALAAYQATLVSPRTAFDDFRDALARGDQRAAARYPLAAQRGLKTFVGPGRCFFCHSGARFSNGEFADIGRPFFTAGGADPGRWGGLQQLLASPYNRLGHVPGAAADAQRNAITRHVLQQPKNFGEFRVPGLRGLAATAPYFHDGSAATLAEVVQHYNQIDTSRLHADGERILQPLGLTAHEVDDLVAFLHTLGPRPATAPR